jgi:hypothetical protein
VSRTSVVIALLNSLELPRITFEDVGFTVLDDVEGVLVLVLELLALVAPELLVAV